MQLVTKNSIHELAAAFPATVGPAAAALAATIAAASRATGSLDAAVTISATALIGSTDDSKVQRFFHCTDLL